MVEKGSCLKILNKSDANKAAVLVAALTASQFNRTMAVSLTDGSGRDYFVNRAHLVDELFVLLKRERLRAVR